MGKFIKGEIVVIPFPFSDLSASKRRPALVLVDLPGDDLILCQTFNRLLTYTKLNMKSKTQPKNVLALLE